MTLGRVSKQILELIIPIIRLLIWTFEFLFQRQYFQQYYMAGNKLSSTIGIPIPFLRPCMVYTRKRRQSAAENLTGHPLLQTFDGIGKVVQKSHRRHLARNPEFASS
jgi:hypothetical protein